MRSVRRFLGTAVDAEVKRFSSDMDEWWDPQGPARALHQLNPLRVRIVSRWFGQQQQQRSLTGLSVLDVGCGGGLLSESLARLGANVTGIDASQRAVEVASARVGLMPLAGTLEYRCATPEQLEGQQFDLVVSSEVIEHVRDVTEFVEALAPLSRGGIVVSTLNRSAKSYLAAIVLGEYALGLVPPGTHDWEKFVTPDELTDCFAKVGFKPKETIGLAYNPFVKPYWKETTDLDVNYISAFSKKNEIV
jgi:ubiquinone biosynthesis O-methyltransferase